MYFKNRAQAGRMIAKELQKYCNQPVAVLALTEGAVIVGAQIAMRLHASLSLLLTENIFLPGEHDALAAVTSTGTFTTNPMFSMGQVEEMLADYHGYIEQQRIEKFHQLNKIVTHSGEVKKSKLRRHIVILVSDGLPSGFSLDVANDYLKTVAIKKLVIASPIASVAAVDRMHLVGDEIVCLDVKPNYIKTNHYYDDNTIPPAKDLFRIMKNIAATWHIEGDEIESPRSSKRRSNQGRVRPRHYFEEAFC